MKDHNEFNNFINSEQEIPAELDSIVLNTSHSMIRKDHYTNFFKMFFIHILAGFSTLLLCPQFGFNPLGANPHFAHSLMDYGALACGGFCGSLFMGSGSLMTILILRKSNLSNLQNNLLSKSLLLTSFFIFIMMISGSLNFEAYYMNFQYLVGWILSAILINYLTIKVKVGGLTL